MNKAKEAVKFRTEDGILVPAVTGEQMREVDRIAMEDFGLSLLQMMENAGRAVASNVAEMLEGAGGRISILAGSGGNGGGGLCCARHLHNRGFQVSFVLSKEVQGITGAAQHQLQILLASGLRPLEPSQGEATVRRAQIVVDALIGYSLRGTPRGRAAELIDLCHRQAQRILSLDVPSGLHATTGQAPGVVLRPERTLTLALPKTGLEHVSGELYLADIGIPLEVFLQLGLSFESPFRTRNWVRLTTGQ